MYGGLTIAEEGRATGFLRSLLPLDSPHLPVAPLLKRICVTVPSPLTVCRLIVEQREMRLGEMKRMFPTLPSKSGKIVTSGLTAAEPVFGRKLGKPVGTVKMKGSTFDPRTKVGMWGCFGCDFRLCLAPRLVLETETDGLRESVDAGAVVRSPPPPHA